MPIETPKEPENGSGNGNNGNSRIRRTVKEDPFHLPEDRELGSILKDLYAFLRKVLGFDEEVQVNETIKLIEEGIVFQGFNVWVLMCSIGIASIGLNANSPAIIIGAMLISPLMGPIRGIGLGVGMIDFRLVIASLKNFGVMVGISLLVSFLYFWISPITRETSELLGRTHPTMLDVLVAFLGGLAGIIAANRGEHITVVPGVAIATALMPPLCTAGYGLATQHWPYFFGAMYLFFLNSVFICLSTILVIRLMKFPRRQFVSQKLENRVKAYTFVFMIIVVTPSVILFLELMEESAFLTRSENFYQEVITPTLQPGTRVDVKFNTKSDTNSIDIGVLFGNVPDRTIQFWESQMDRYKLSDAQISIYQGQDFGKLIQQAMYKDGEQRVGDAPDVLTFITRRDSIIEDLRSQLDNIERHQWNVDYLKDQFAIDYPQMERFVLAQGVNSDSSKNFANIFYLVPTWKKKPSPNELKVITKDLKAKVRLYLKQLFDIEAQEVVVAHRDIKTGLP
ncbi:DUF389 domain-containing protein [Pontibacter sp. G13]|uniref:DUF389 domain-containing protein n=1 Tax=Pontibacter sp. G13 TaxID=3074898 RepID=UPI00288B9D3F|nr:DUF389 domain-containing protein [Pontibacter sp. G13]WNJ18907.1 DUF389 domain-containing protein [Pontibacter sp. G13]